MVFKILSAMVNDGFEVNDGLDVPLHKKCVYSIGDEMRIHSRPLKYTSVGFLSIETVHTMMQ